jgi:hypothetical protein
MTERIFKQTERDFWLYPKLLLVVAGGAVITAILQRWLPNSAVILGLLPFIALFGFMDRPVTYRQWFMRIAIILVYLLILFPVLSLGRTHIHVTWNLPTAVLGIIGGSLLFGLSLSQRWASWCNNKPFSVPYLVLFISLWATMGGAFYLLTRLIGN